MMALIDRQYLQTPFYGSRRMAAWLQAQGHAVNRKGPPQTVEHEELTQRTNRRSGRADEARRARLILLLDAGHTWASIREKLDCPGSFIDRWGKRFAAERLGGLFSR